MVFWKFSTRVPNSICESEIPRVGCFKVLLPEADFLSLLRIGRREREGGCLFHGEILKKVSFTCFFRNLLSFLFLFLYFRTLMFFSARYFYLFIISSFSVWLFIILSVSVSLFVSLLLSLRISILTFSYTATHAIMHCFSEFCLTFQFYFSATYLSMRFKEPFLTSAVRDGSVYEHSAPGPHPSISLSLSLPQTWCGHKQDVLSKEKKKIMRKS